MGRVLEIFRVKSGWVESLRLIINGFLECQTSDRCKKKEINK